MNTEAFFAAVLPDSGTRLIVPCVSNGTKGKFEKARVCTTNAQAATVALSLDKLGRTVYHACASFGDSGSRTAEDAVAVKSFWMDVDCGPDKPYPDQEEGLDAIEEFRKELVLPAPLLVRSGRGWHVYFRLEEEIAPVAWKLTATLLKRAAVKQGLQADPTRTADLASVLRPAGTTHRKGKPTTVEVVQDGRAVPHAYIHQQLLSFLGEEDDLGAAPSHVAVNNNDLSVKYDGPPVSPDDVATICGIIKEFKETGGTEMEEPLWRGCLGVVLHCEGGADTAHEWSALDPRYSHDETQAKLDGLDGTGPTLCATLEPYRPDVCAACPLYQKCKSPIVGPRRVPTAPPAALPPQAAAAPVHPLSPIAPRYTWGVVSGVSGIVTKVKNKVTGVDEDRIITRTLFYPVDTVREASGASRQIIRAEYNNGEVSTFDLPLGIVGSGGAKLAEALTSQMIVLEPGMTNAAQQYLQTWLNFHSANIATSKVRESFGWAENDSFIFGPRRYQTDGTVIPAFLSGSAKNRQEAFTPVGSLETWKAIIDRAYNHDSTIPMQFAILASMGAPLLKFFVDYAGCTVYMHSEDSGQGKTTAEHACLSVWARWGDAEISYKGITENALNGLLGTYRHLPIVLDEMTQIEPALASSFVHMVTMGKPKIRCEQTGALKDDKLRWNTFMISSGNIMLSDKLSQDRGHAQAEMARVWEYTIPDVKQLGIIDQSEAMELFPQLAENYGVAGDAFLRYVVAHQPQVKQTLKSVQQTLTKVLGLKQDERYWTVLLSCVITAHKIATSLGLVSFDRTALMKWIQAILLNNRANMSGAALKGAHGFSRMMNDINQGIIVTVGRGDAIGRDARELGAVRGQVCGRAVLSPPFPPKGTTPEKPLLAISVDAIKRWCIKDKTSSAALIDSAVQAGQLKKGYVMMRLGIGTQSYSHLGEVKCVLATDAYVQSMGAQHANLSIVGGTP